MNRDFENSGLKSSSLIRLGFINIVDKKVIPRVIGEIPSIMIKTLQERLANELIK